MAHVNSRVASVRLDDSTATIAVISGSVTAVTINGGIELLEDTGIGDSNRTRIEGLDNSPTITLTGMLDSTTEAILAPLTNGTSITKTVGIGLVSGQYLNGEGWPETGDFSVSRGDLTTWTLNLIVDAGLTRTSVTAS